MYSESSCAKLQTKLTINSSLPLDPAGGSAPQTRCASPPRLRHLLLRQLLESGSARESKHLHRSLAVDMARTLAYRIQQCNRTHFRWSTSQISRRYNFRRINALKSKKLSRLRSELRRVKFFLLPWTPWYAWRHSTWNANRELLLLAECFTALVQRLSNRVRISILLLIK